MNNNTAYGLTRGTGTISMFICNLRIVAIVLVCFCISESYSNAQDILKLKSGKEIRANILEEGTDIIKYREFDNPSGPVYSVKKDQVESVKYKKGKRETQNAEPKELNINEPAVVSDTNSKLTMKRRYIVLNGQVQSPRNVKSIMFDNPEALANYEKGKKMCDMSNACAYGIIIVSLTTSIIANGKSDPDESRKISAIGLGIDGGLLIGGIILAVSGKQKIRKSVELYNSSLDKPVTYRIDFGIQDNGIGFGVRF
jgi:hypothetical protein